MNSAVDAAGRMLVDSASYTDEERLHDGLALLRRDAPVHWVEAEGFRPFWAITRYQDVAEVELAADVFANGPHPVLRPAAVEDRMAANGGDFRTLLHMDGAEHRAMRAVAASWFEPRAVRRLRSWIERSARRLVDRMVDLGGECDFLEDVGKVLPLYTVLPLLGLPETELPMVRKLSQAFFDDDDDIVDVKREVLDFFADLVASRRRTPTDDLASAIAGARVNGEPLSDHDAISYYFLITVAGHETTGEVLAGGLHALIDRPEHRGLLRRDSALIPGAVDEMLRWVSPTRTFMRTAVEHYQLRDKVIRPGDGVLLHYVSANRDEEVFANPFEFDIFRSPNRHLSFGRGAHYCLGAALAKMQVEIFFAELLPRLREIELTGVPELLEGTFLGGLKQLPIRYVLT